MPNWAEQVTAIATAVSALGLLSAIGAVIFAGQQAREARMGRQAETAVEFVYPMFFRLVTKMRAAV